MKKPFGDKALGFTEKHTTCLIGAWVLLIVSSLLWNLYRIHDSVLEKARIETRSIFELTLVYRKWAASHGGVYVPVTDKTKPNPYLKSHRRDVKTTDGIELTLVNPAWMTRQAFEILERQSPYSPKSRITSPKYLNPINKPDEWEMKALSAFEKDKKEFSEVTMIDNKRYLRLMKPLYVEVECLQCHGYQGYKVGELRGGIGIAVPLLPFYNEEKTAFVIAIFTHLLIGSAGVIIILLFSANIRRSQERLIKSEWQFRTLSEFSTDWEYWITEQREILYISPSCERITGYKPDEFIQKPNLIRDIICEEDRTNFDRHLEDFKSPTHEELQFRIITKSGETKWISHVCSPIYDKGLIGRRASNRDITDKKRLEERLLQAQKMESLGMLAGGVAHDFNNLLTAIIGYSSLIMNEEIDDRIKGFVKNVLKASDKARVLTSSLLAFSRKQVIDPKPISLNETLENLTKILHRLIPEDIALTIEYASPDYPVYADCHQIEQVIINMVTNAKDAMPRGGKISISLSSIDISEGLASIYEAKAGRYMLLTISDSGLGIDKKDLPHIFEPFYTTKEKGKGTGLGLSMVYGIVKQHNGFIGVYSEKGLGTTFKIYLPVYASVSYTQDTQATISDSVNLGGNETILLVDDEDSIRDFIREMLQYYGYKVLIAKDGEEAVQVYKGQHEAIDMVLLDVIMPRKNGREALNELREINPKLKVLFMSGYADDVISIKEIHEEGLDFISKPMTPEALLTKIRVVIDKGQ